MSRTATGSITVNPSAYADDHSYYSLNSSSNAYTDTSSTTYAQANITRGAQAETWVYLIFDTSSIPDGSTINSVSCKAKGVANGNTSQVPTKWMCTFSGTSQKGDTYNLGTSTTVRELSVGTWTLAEVRNARLKFYAQRGTSGTTNNYYIRMYGAEFTVSYTYTIYSVSASSSFAGVTTSVSDNEKQSGGTVTVTISGASGKSIVVTDNGVDVTGQLAVSGSNYIYTISGISADHVVLVAEGEAMGQSIFLKQNGAWSTVDSVYVKSNGVWVPADSIYVKNNGSWES